MDGDREAEIITSVQNGDRAAFELLVRRFQTLLFRVVGNLVGSLQAEDIVQEVFMAAYANLHRFDPCKGSLRTWLLAIARNKAFNATRKKRERTGNNLPQLKDERTPADLLLTKEIFERLDRALDQLKYREKVIFVLAEIEGLSYAEIAAIENLPLGTVKSKLARTRAKLRAMIKEAEEHHEK